MPSCKSKIPTRKISWLPTTTTTTSGTVSLKNMKRERSQQKALPILYAYPSCYGNGHQDIEKAPVDIKQHPLHPNHSLQLVFSFGNSERRNCYCCDRYLHEVFYYCSSCDFAIRKDCAFNKQPLLAIDHPKWHHHTLQLFPRPSSLICNVCALPCSVPYVYMCPPCDFVVHQQCTSLPCVIKISRHVHRLSFTFSFDQGDRSCAVCRKMIENRYGGYRCTKSDGGCSYVAHSRCATQRNMWDGVDLDGVLEDIEEEEVESFVRISDGLIQHFSHQHHHLSLDENTGRDYDDKKLCQICMEPIYFGNLYSCTECNFILHENCANLSGGIHHPIHPHKLTLALTTGVNRQSCSACNLPTRTGFFFYVCNAKRCDFKLHVSCATMNEPLVHGSHMKQLFLTSKPKEKRQCWVCENERTETFNCIQDCEFSLCFGCATIPEKLRYKHDKHMLTLVYGKETSSMRYWCEICEGEIKEKQRYYKCDEYCCVTLHMTCLLGVDFQMKLGSFGFIFGRKVDTLANNEHMTRPLCSKCDKRCPYNVLHRWSGKLFCSSKCIERVRLPVASGIDRR